MAVANRVKNVETKPDMLVDTPMTKSDSSESFSDLEVVQEDEIQVSTSEDVEGSFGSILNKFVEKVSSMTPAGSKDLIDHHGGKASGKDHEKLLGSAGGEVKKKISDWAAMESGLEMDQGVSVPDSSSSDNHSLHSEFKPRLKRAPYKMTALEKEWEFVMCSNNPKRVKSFLDEHPFQEEPNEKVRFVNYRSKINGYTVLHYAAQCCNNDLVGELIKNRGVDASIVNNSGMTPLHTLAQVKLGPNETEIKKAILAELLLLPKIRNMHGNDREVLEPVLTSPFVRDYFGRRACDLLPPEQMQMLRATFRGGYEDLPIQGKPKDKEHDGGMRNQPANPGEKTSFFRSMFGPSKQDSGSSYKQAEANVRRISAPQSAAPAGFKKVSHGIQSSARMLPGLNRSQSILKTQQAQTPKPAGSTTPRRQALSAQTSFRSPAQNSPRKMGSAAQIMAKSPLAGEKITEDAEE